MTDWPPDVTLLVGVAVIVDDSEGVDKEGEIEVDVGVVLVTLGVAGINEQPAAANTNNMTDPRTAIHRL